MPRILGMFEGFRRGDDLEKALQEHLGQSLKEFSDAVLGYTASVAASIPLAAQYGPEDLEVLRKAAAANPKDAAAKAEHALGLLQTEKAAQAAEEAASAIKLEPSCAPAERVLGEVKVSQGAFEDAIKHLTRSAELNPRQMDVHLRLASIAREQNRLTEAVEHLRKAAECYSRSPAVYQLMEEVADRLTDTKLRLDALEGMLKCRPSAAYAAEKLVKVYAAVERHEDVERVARIFFQYNPYLTGPHEVLARSYQARKKLDAAAQECLVCVQIDPRKIENHLTLAKVLLANDQRPEAKRVLTEASKADPKNEEVKRLLDELGP
jgi:tetratricopeptide (TPR) repeat protein